MLNSLKPARFSIEFRLTAVSFLLNLAVETSLVFLPLYASSLSASNLEVGFIAASYGLAYFASSLLFGRLSDIYGRLAFIRLGLGASALAYLAQLVARSPLILLITRGILGFCLGVSAAAVMAYTYEKLKKVGGFSSYGALGWCIGAAFAAVVHSYTVLFVASAVSSLLAFGTVMTLTEAPENHSLQQVPRSLFPLNMIKENRKVYFALLARQLGANAVWAIFPLYLTGIGASKTWVAIMDGINMGGQFIAMRFVEQYNSARLFQVGLLLSMAIFGIFGIANNYLQVVPVQAVVAVAWSFMFVGSLSYLLKKNPEHGTVSGLLYSTIYLSAGIGPFVGGIVSQVWGFKALMFVSSVFSLLGFFLSLGISVPPAERGHSAEKH
jgi:MFS family permease